MSCPAPGTNVNKVVGFESYPMAWKACTSSSSSSACAECEQHIEHDVNPDLVCTKHHDAFLAQLLKVCPAEAGPSTLLLDADCISTLHAGASSLCNDAGMEYMC